MLAQDQRIRAVLNAPDGPLPPVDPEALRRYYRFLKGRLLLPFRAVYFEQVNRWEDARYRVTVVGLHDPAELPADQGLVCRAVRQGKPVDLPLVELEIDHENPNFQLIEDYWSWAWNRLPMARAAG